MPTRTLTVGEALLQEFSALRKLLQQRLLFDDVSQYRSIIDVARRSSIIESKVTLSVGTSILVAPANPRRWAIGFTASTNGTFMFSTSATNDPDQGFRVASNDDKFLTMDKHLSLPMAEWWGILNAGPQTDCTVFQVIMPNNLF